MFDVVQRVLSLPPHLGGWPCTVPDLPPHVRVLEHHPWKSPLVPLQQTRTMLSDDCNNIYRVAAWPRGRHHGQKAMKRSDQPCHASNHTSATACRLLRLHVGSPFNACAAYNHAVWTRRMVLIAKRSKAETRPATPSPQHDMRRAMGYDTGACRTGSCKLQHCESGVRTI
jgi:hypothetical protein